MKKFQLPKNLRYALIFLFLIFFAALAGQPFPEGYFHLADPLVMMAAAVLPLPLALITSVIACVAVDCIKGYTLLALTTAIAKILLVLAVKGLLKLPAAQKFPDLIAAPAALLSIPCNYLGCAAVYFYTAFSGETSIAKQLSTALSYATRVLQKETVQALLGVLLFVLLYGVYKKMKDRRAKKPTDEE
ncbi:MAG: hypothetical protein IJ294_05555 [Clostridia bacterium]|nr:hypothetical protein [Clostridia bacterium]